MFNQSPSNMSAVSLLEDTERRIYPKVFRPGQRKALEFIVSDHERSRYAFELPTAYGKTWVILMAYALMKAQGRANRLLWIIPSDIQRTQAEIAALKDANTLGLAFSGAALCDGGDHVLKQQYQNTAEIFVATVHSIKGDSGFFSDLMEKGDWLVCCDEYHRYPVEGEWGQAIQALPSEVLMGVSGTPLRTDAKPTLFPKPDVEVSLRTAREEGAIRGINLHVESYALDFSIDDDLIRLTTKNIKAQLEAYGCKDLSELEVRKRVRYHTKYISSMLTAAIETMLSKQLVKGARHQMIVFAMSVAHAKALSGTINQMNGEVLSDWVGEGPDGRGGKENSEVIDSFINYKQNPEEGQARGINCLVQVKKAAEGFDSVYASTLAYLNLLTGRSVEADQSLGRGLRRHPEIADPALDMCDVYVSEDTGLADYYDSLVKGMAPKTPEAGPPRGPLDDLRWIDIPPFFLVDVEHTGEVTSYPLGPPPGKEPVAQEVMDNYLKKNPDVDHDLINTLINEALHRADTPVRTESSLRAEAARLLNMCASILAGNIARRRFGKSYEKSAKGDIWKKINGQLKSRFGPRNSLTRRDMSAAYDFLRTMNAEIGCMDKEELPEWAEL